MGEVYMHEAVSRPAAADPRYGMCVGGGEEKGEGGGPGARPSAAISAD